MSMLTDLWRNAPISDTAKTYIEGLVAGFIGLTVLEILFRVFAWWAVLVK